MYPDSAGAETGAESIESLECRLKHARKAAKRRRKQEKAQERLRRAKAARIELAQATLEAVADDEGADDGVRVLAATRLLEWTKVD